LLCLLVGFSIHAQKEGVNWYSGDSVGLRFETKVPIQLTDGIIPTAEGTSVMSDSVGNLLFYTDGITVWNANHDVVRNGNGLKGHLSSYQSALILKQPETHLYYIFTSSSINGSVTDNQGINFSILDLKANGGNGEITRKNVKILGSSTEGITAKKVPGKEEYCIAAVEYGSPDLVLFSLNKSGVQLVRRVSVGNESFYGKSQIKFSRRGNYIAFSQKTQYWSKAKVYLIDIELDNMSVSEVRFIDHFATTGLEFSPNEKYLYIMGGPRQTFNYPNIKFGLYQVTVDSINNKVINSDCANLVYQTNGSATMAITPFGEIFLASLTSNLEIAYDVIRNPNSFNDCGFERGIQVFSDSKIVISSIPNICVDYTLGSYIDAAESCTDSLITLKVNRYYADSVMWVIDDAYLETIIYDTTQFRFETSGVHQVQAVLFYGEERDTVSLDLEIHEPPSINLGVDTLLCSGETLELAVDSSSAVDSIRWSTVTTTEQIAVSKAGEYRVTVSNKYCIASDTIKVEYISCELLFDSMCYGDNTIHLLDDESIDSLRWVLTDSEELSNTNKLKHTYSNEGWQAVDLTAYKNGLQKKLSDSVYITGMPNNYLADSLTICEPQPLIPNLSTSNFDSYLWQDGTSSKEILADYSGVYTLELEKNSCFALDSTYVYVEDCKCAVYIPNSFSPNGDQLNDVFNVWTECDISDMSLEVYSRWGDKIINSQTGWDGTFQSAPCQNGVYLWQISYRNKKGKMLYEKGTVHLVR
jgi:gliding motility-associated-like protein